MGTMGKKKRMILPALGLLLIAGAAAGLLLARPWAWVNLNGGGRMERRTYELLQKRGQADEAVMEADARCRVLFALGYDEGLIDFRDMAGFWKSLEAENARRRDDIENGRTVFGPAQYAASDYLDYTVSNLMLQLPGRLGENGRLRLAEEDLRRYYEEHKEEKYRYTARVELEILTLDPERGDLRVAQAAIQQDLRDGVDFRDIMIRYDPEREPTKTLIKENTKMHAAFADLYALAAVSEPGVVSGPFTLSGGVVFFRLLSYEPERIAPFAEALYYIRGDAQEENFAQFLQRETWKLIGRGMPTQ